VLNAEQVRRFVTIATLALAAALAVAAAALPPREYGLEQEYRPKPDCPRQPCRATGRVTGYQIMQLKQREGDAVTEYPTRVRRRNGWLVAFSLTLGKPINRDRTFFNRLWGRPASARISILEPDPPKGDRRNRHQRFRLHNQSEVKELPRFFGKKAWFTLKRRMHVRKGQVIALTLPTWAPVLATNLRGKERWRSSRNRRRCENVQRSAARQKVGKLRDYRCVHTTARLLFTALVVHKTPENKSR
jgi:hypothetical protein